MLKHLSCCSLLFVSLSLLPIGASANSEPYTKKQAPIKTHDKKENLGWHYYWDEEKKKKEEKKKLEVKPTAKATPAKPVQPFSTEWFQKNYEKVKQVAIDNPSKENMRALLYVERVMADKGETFARRKQFVQSVDPLLQEGTRIPMMGTAKNALLIYKDEQKKEALKEMQKHVGIAFFYDGNCNFCHQMIPVINMLKSRSGVDVRVFAINSPRLDIPRLDSSIPVFHDQGLSSTFQISYWPAVVMLRPPQDVFVVAQGAVALDELTRRLVNVAFDQHILDEEWFYRVYPEQKGLIGTEQLKSLNAEHTDDPVQMINQVIQMLDNPDGAYMSGKEAK